MKIKTRLLTATMSLATMSLATVVLATMALTTMSAYAHHSATMFDDTKMVELTGIVKEFQYSNPHSWLLVDVTNPDSTVTTWGFEAEGPSTLMRAGIRKSSFPPGAEIVIRGRPLKDGRPAAAWVDAVVDGERVNPGSGFAINAASD